MATLTPTITALKRVERRIPKQSSAVRRSTIPAATRLWWVPSSHDGRVTPNVSLMTVWK